MRVGLTLGARRKTDQDQTETKNIRFHVLNTPAETGPSARVIALALSRSGKEQYERQRTGSADACAYVCLVSKAPTLRHRHDDTSTRMLRRRLSFQRGPLAV